MYCPQPTAELAVSLRYHARVFGRCALVYIVVSLIVQAVRDQPQSDTELRLDLELQRMDHAMVDEFYSDVEDATDALPEFLVDSAGEMNQQNTESKEEHEEEHEEEKEEENEEENKEENEEENKEETADEYPKLMILILSAPGKSYRLIENYFLNRFL